MTPPKLYKCPAPDCEKKFTTFQKTKEHMTGCRKYINYKFDYQPTYETAKKDKVTTGG